MHCRRACSFVDGINALAPLIGLPGSRLLGGGPHQAQRGAAVAVCGALWRGGGAGRGVGNGYSGKTAVRYPIGPSFIRLQ